MTILDSKENERGYVAGAYGDRRIRSFASSEPPIEFENEWVSVPEEDKKELVDWLNTLNIDQQLDKQSFIAQSSNPVMKYLVEEKILSAPDVDIDTDTDKFEGLKITEHDTAQEFMDVFIPHKKESQIIPRLRLWKKQIGFIINEEAHFVLLSTLHPVWHPQSQVKLAKIAEEKMKSSPAKNDEHLDKIFGTTTSHPFGPYWAGILKLSVPELSTIIGGSQNALKIPRPRYTIEWVNLKNPHDRKIVKYESFEISEMIKNVDILETDGYDKAPKIYPETCQIEYGANKVKTGLSYEERIKLNPLIR